MLKTTNRRLSSAEVSELFDGHAQSVHNRYFHLNWMPSAGDHPQFVVVTPKKLSLNAVHRNRLRRRIYPIVRHGFSAWTEGVRVAIVVKRAALEATRDVFRESLSRLISEIR